MKRLDILIATIIGLTSILQVAEPCGSGTNTAAVTTPSPKNLWYRCLAPDATAAVCKQGTCADTDLFLTPTPGIANETLCKATTYYQQCYTYTKDTTGVGTCQADAARCTATDQIKLVEVANDKTCGSYPDTVSSSFFRCVSKVNAAVTCRPQVAGCSSTEEQVPFGRAYLTETDCTTYSPTSFYRCVFQNNATCRLASAGCRATETRSPAAESFTTESLCFARGPPLYDLCYDFTHSPTSDFKRCQLSDIGCTGSNKKKVYTGLNDFTCNGYDNLPPGVVAVYDYIRCASNTATMCRPRIVGCNPNTEIRTPASIFYSALSDCTADTDEYIMCGLSWDSNPMTHCTCSQTPLGCPVSSRGYIDTSYISSATFCGDFCQAQAPSFTTCKVIGNDLKACFCIPAATCTELAASGDFTTTATGTFSKIADCNQACIF